MLTTSPNTMTKYSMRINEILTEWREAYLYHATTIPGAISIWKADSLRGGSGPSVGKNQFRGPSTTRSYHYALGYMKNENRDNTGGVIFWINQELVKRDLGRRRLKGYDWFTDHDPSDTSDEFQRRSELHDTDRFETVIKGGLTPFKKYLVKIEIWLPRTFDRAPPPADADEDELFAWRNRTGKYSLDPKDPYKGQINVRPDQEVIKKYTSDPAAKQAWESMLSDPRTDVKSELGMPKKYQGAPISIKRQYDRNHPMYGGGRW